MTVKLPSRISIQNEQNRNHQSSVNFACIVIYINHFHKKNNLELEKFGVQIIFQ